MYEVHEIATGLEFPEGPIAMADGSALVVEIKRGTLSRVTPDGSVSVVAALVEGPNGAAIGPDGAVYVCNNGGFQWHEFGELTLPGEQPDDYTTGHIDRVDLATGEVTTLYRDCDGNRLAGPNDIVFDSSGNFWFTDVGKTRPRDKDRGGVYYASPDGSMIREVIYPMETPNGIGLSPGGDRLYVADSISARVWWWDLSGPGEIVAASPLGPGGNLLVGLGGNQYLDSLAVEADGRVDVATIVNAGITVITPEGESEHVPLPDLLTTNICFGGDDLRTAYCTLSGTGKLVAMDWPRPGLKLEFNA